MALPGALSNFKVCPMCGPKASIFCMMISVWGIIFLGILGGFFYWNALTLYEELKYHKVGAEWNNAEVKAAYRSNAYNCWIAAVLYIITLVITYFQNRWNTSSPI